MTDPILLQFIDKVLKNNLDYCVICMRTSAERRLEKPVYLKKFIENVSNLDDQCFNFKRAQQLVCFVCERQAAAAHRFLTALGLATHAHTAVHQLNESPTLRYQFHASYIQHAACYPILDLAKKEKTESMLHLEMRLRQQRINSQLLMTEVLTVSTPSTNDNIPDTLSLDCEVTSGPGESRDMYVIPDLLPNADGRTCDTSDIKIESEIKEEPILILEDDDCIPLGPATLAQNTTAPTFQKIAPRVDKASCFGPQSTGHRTGTMTSILRTSQNGTRTQNPQPRAGANTREDRENICKQSTLPSTTFIVHPLVFNSGMMTVPSLSANIMEGQLVTSDRHSLTFETPQLVIQTENNMEFITDPEKVATILKQLSHHEASKVFIFKAMKESQKSSIFPEQNGDATKVVTDNSSDTSQRADCSKVATICTVGEARSLDSTVKRDAGTHARESAVRDGGKHAKESGVRDKGVRSEERLRDRGVCPIESGVRDGGKHVKESGVRGNEGPQLRSDRIDWEDKIPMDVISFVDDDETTCKKARGSDHPPPPLGISNVTSLNKDFVVIDLC